MTTQIPPIPPGDILRTAHLLSRISGRTATPVYDNGAWRFRIELTREDAGALISAVDNPESFPRLIAPLLERYRATR